MRAGVKTNAAGTRPAPAIIQPRAGTKKDRLVSLLSKKAGADVAALSAALGWQAHTTRAALTRLRQAGFPLEAAKPAGGGATVYRIAVEKRPAGSAE
jgi:predicted ArsR family transcriptional regulator